MSRIRAADVFLIILCLFAIAWVIMPTEPKTIGRDCQSQGEGK
jgi:hypothetical protein